MLHRYIAPIVLAVASATPAHADDKLAAAFGRPAHFDPIAAAAKAEAKLYGGSWEHIAARSRLYRQRELAREFAEATRTGETNSITPEHRRAYQKEILASRSLAKRNRALERSSMISAAGSVETRRQFAAFARVALPR